MYGQYQIKITAQIDKSSKDEYSATVFRGNQRIYVGKEKFNTPFRAERDATLAIFRMIDCDHENMSYGDVNDFPHPVDADGVGNEIMGWENVCADCGYRQIITEDEMQSDDYYL